MIKIKCEFEVTHEQLDEIRSTIEKFAPKTEAQPQAGDSGLDGLAHEIWAAAQLMPNEGIVDGVDRIKKVLEEAVEISIQHPQPVMCLGCEYWRMPSYGHCMRGEGVEFCFKVGTHTGVR